MKVFARIEMDVTLDYPDQQVIYRVEQVDPRTLKIIAEPSLPLTAISLDVRSPLEFQA